MKPAKERYQALIHPKATASGCLVWLGALSGRGSGRFWLGGGQVMVAHRYGWEVAYGQGSLASVDVIRHICDEAWCQRPEHWVLGTAQQNAREWGARRLIPGSPLRDTRGALGRAHAVRAAALEGTDLDEALRAGDPWADQYQDQLPTEDPR